MNRKPAARVDIYADVTNRIIEALESGPAPWTKFWQSSADTWRPVNHGSNRAYRGVNLLLLADICHRRGLAHNRWLTFNQARELGGSVRKGAKGVAVVLWRPIGETQLEVKSDNANAEGSEDPRAVVMRQFHVFNVADCDGLAESMHDAPANETLASQIVHKSGARIIPGEPCYRPGDDIVQLPLVSAFDSEAAFYAAAFHELAHYAEYRIMPCRSQRGLSVDASRRRRAA